MLDRFASIRKNGHGEYALEHSCVNRSPQRIRLRGSKYENV
jgi:hypothetical protein